MNCMNLGLPPLETKNGENNSFTKHVKYLPDSIRKEVKLLCKQYYILSIEQCGEDYSFDENGNEVCLINENFVSQKKWIMDQMFDIKIEYMNTETEQRFFKVFLSYKKD